MKIGILTLGCKVNQYETQALEVLAAARGHVLVPFEAEADAYVVNSCTVTAVSDKKSRAALRQARSRNPAAVVAVCGCYAQTGGDALQTLEVDLIAGTTDRGLFLDRLEAVAAARRQRAEGVTPRDVFVDDVMTRRAFERLPAGGLEGRTRAMLKVEDGCVNFCAYCVIPYARGPVCSLPLSEAVAEAVRLYTEGYRELVVTGIEISSWGADIGDGRGLIDLLEAVCAAAPRLRVRLGSLEPRTVTEAFCLRLSALPNVCPHFHLSLQSGCDTVLRRMCRKYGTARYLESLALLRAHFDDPAVAADLIVGFPGETEAEFEETLDFLRVCAFSSLHIFPYSRRPGTPAADMPEQVPRAVKRARAARAGAVAAELEAAYLTRQVGKTLPVLFEQELDGLWRGHAPNYAEVRAAGEGLHNTVREVRITAVGEGYLTGELAHTE